MKRERFRSIEESIGEDNERGSVKRVNVEDARSLLATVSRWWRLFNIIKACYDHVHSQKQEDEG